MSETNGSAAKPDLAVLREEIKQTRADLGETVQALAARADVKARAKEQVVQTRQRVLTQAAELTGRVREAAREPVSETGARVRANPAPVLLVAAGLAALVGVILIVRGRR
ncbi:ElaB/YqjD/DUF883 family membrane-anchored ribosome-binding protein [Actinoplanes lutulentus]|uniref:Uncharacterized protein DUF3618 n=1 Tax=Actinoplanes lutulentus TaxID=1287878 RepID=A0A327ZLU8_9ACTN|nr:DUF3618 domain-containing protein [Actinoplanes lutulentus]MBB2942899.1 ElaB/YqjD/DUF883 family membrane-anchored ribosome-binding protein [Actinoplanes lutulentus]RAK38477.1 uncharacterized protein DUF3618 [Actinoplanes lutulentus]